MTAIPTHRPSAAGTDFRQVEHGHIPLRRLVRVEIRKLTDTRAGFWVLASLGLISVVAVAAMLTFVKSTDLDVTSIFGVLSIPAGILLPILAVLLVTSEWNQRTGLTTFTIEPRRGRVVTAKLLACVAVAVLALVGTLILAGLGNVLADALRSGAGHWDLPIRLVGYAAVGWAATLLMAFGFALILRNSAAGIVAIFALPAVWAVVSSVVPWLHDHVQPWADMQAAQAPFRSGDAASATDWAHFGVAAAIWVLVPLVVGWWRAIRAEFH